MEPKSMLTQMGISTISLLGLVAIFYRNRTARKNPSTSKTRGGLDSFEVGLLKIRLEQIDKGDPGFKKAQAEHYSKSKGVVGRQIIYRVSYDGILDADGKPKVFAYMLWQSPPGFLEYRRLIAPRLTAAIDQKIKRLEESISPNSSRERTEAVKKQIGDLKGLITNSMISNGLFRMLVPTREYPCVDFTTAILEVCERALPKDWKGKYPGVGRIIALETLVQLPRLGRLYVKNGWRLLTLTKGVELRRSSAVGPQEVSSGEGWGGGVRRAESVPHRKLVYVKPLPEEIDALIAVLEGKENE